LWFREKYRALVWWFRVFLVDILSSKSFWFGPWTPPKKVQNRFQWSDFQKKYTKMIALKNWVGNNDKKKFFFSRPKPVPRPVANKKFWFFCRNGCIMHWQVILSLETLFENQSLKKYSLFCENRFFSNLCFQSSEISPESPIHDRPREIVF